MKLLFLSLLYPVELRDEAMRCSKTGLQNQADGFQQSLLRGLKANGADVWTANSLPVGVYPLQYRRLFLRAQRFNERLQELGCVNLPYLKQKQRARRAERAIVAWARQSDEHRDVLVYSLYLPYLRAVARAKRRCPDLRVHGIVTDLPNELGISSGRRGLLKRLETRWGSDSLRLCEAFDSFILLTRGMADVLPVGKKPCLVLEGIAPAEEAPLPEASASAAVQAAIASKRPSVLYTGTLNREFQIDRLLEAFDDPSMQDVELWFCGRGDMDAEIARRADSHSNFRVFGFVRREEAQLLQRHATVLVNPRADEGAFTRYSFPSKTMEYMLSGRPVLCCKLPGIPTEYDPYLCYLPACTPQAIREGVHALLARPEAERNALGQRARDFVLCGKNERAQAEKLLAHLQAVT